LGSRDVIGHVIIRLPYGLEYPYGTWS